MPAARTWAGAWCVPFAIRWTTCAGWWVSLSHVWAFSGNLGGLGIDVEDVSEIGLQFDRGVLGSVHLDFCQRPPRHTLEMIGNQGTITWDNASGGGAPVPRRGKRHGKISLRRMVLTAMTCSWLRHVISSI